VAWLKDHYPALESIGVVDNKKSLRCNIRYNNISKVRKASRNGQVPNFYIVQGVRRDEGKAVKIIIDHLLCILRQSLLTTPRRSGIH